MNQPNWHAIHAATADRLRQEERVNCATHAVGLLLAIFACVWLVAAAARHGTTIQLVACMLYGLSLVAVYAGSTLSHAFLVNPWRRIFRIVDQACIYLLIAATFTPPAVTYLPPGPWWLVPMVMWSLALVGFASKAFYAHQIDAVRTYHHVLVGSIPIFAVQPLATLAPLSLLGWLIAGGACYSIGTFFLNHDYRRHFHAVWHLLVIAGSTCHFVGIYLYCTSPPV